MISKTLAAFAVCCIFACTVKTEQSADTSAARDSAISSAPPDKVILDKGESNVRTVDSSAMPAPVTPSPLPPRASPPSTGLTISSNTFGPLRVGMTVAEAAKAMGGGFAAPANYSGGCGYAKLVKAPTGLAVMLDNNRIARFEVRSGGVTTAEGAKIGDSEARINSLYAGKVTTTPHKYVQGGHYLTVTPSAGSTNRIVFETDGAKVTEYRSGKTPEVLQVER